MARTSRAEALMKLEPEDRRAELKAMGHRQRRSLQRHWRLWAHDGQVPPDGSWHTWLVMGGRGYGKTRAGAEWVREIAAANPAARIALIGASLSEARAVMVEGPSGLLEVSPPRRRPMFEPSKRLLTWPNGAEARIHSAGEPESLRGPQHSHAWCDEIGKWDGTSGRARAAWDNMVLGLRLGSLPRVVATTTPRAVPLLKTLLTQSDVSVTHGTTQDNADNLPTGFFRSVRVRFAASHARQVLSVRRIGSFAASEPLFLTTIP